MWDICFFVVNGHEALALHSSLGDKLTLISCNVHDKKKMHAFAFVCKISDCGTHVFGAVSGEKGQKQSKSLKNHECRPVAQPDCQFLGIEARFGNLSRGADMAVSLL